MFGTFARARPRCSAVPPQRCRTRAANATSHTAPLPSPAHVADGSRRPPTPSHGSRKRPPRTAEVPLPAALRRRALAPAALEARRRPAELRERGLGADAVRSDLAQAGVVERIGRVGVVGQP